MTDLVERLAEKARQEEATSMGIEGLIHFMLNAIADELDVEAHRRMGGHDFAGHYFTCRDWLRTQASQPTRTSETDVDYLDRTEGE